MNDNDTRLIEDYLPIEDISAEASREKNVRKGHISTLHLWWARRPLVACRAAVYGALVSSTRFQPATGPDGKRVSLGRANAAKFVKSLCTYPAPEIAVAEARKHIFEAHAERLTTQLGKTVTAEDIIAGRAPRPKVLDMFAGGGSIPLEASRLGCDAYAMDLNPVAYIVELCTLVYPQKYGKPEPTTRGMTGPKNTEGEITWGGLGEEVRYWGNRVLEHVKGEIADLYPLIPEPGFKREKTATQTNWLKERDTEDVRPGFMTPVAYLWTRKVVCKNPNCRSTVPLLKQTWLCKKPGRYVALKVVAPRGTKEVSFEVVEAPSENGLGFDPSSFSKGGNATCPFCGTVADVDYVKAEGWAGRMGQQMTALVCVKAGAEGKVYLSANAIPEFIPDADAIQTRIFELCASTGLTEPTEQIANLSPESSANTLGTRVRPYGIKTWANGFTPRQRLSLLSFCAAIRKAYEEMQAAGVSCEHAKAVATNLACVLDKQADFNSAHCVLKADGGRGIVHTFGRHVFTMVWDFAEANPFNREIACWASSLKEVCDNIEDLVMDFAATVERGSALQLPVATNSIDAVISDPPYYDNVPYADISDFFFVWLKRSIGYLYPEHFAATLTPKKQEAIADSARHGGDKRKATKAYEQMMLGAFVEAHRVLKQEGQIVVVYAHKTTLGWSTLVDAMRGAGFTVTEAWPLDTETSGRLRAQDSSALASSIFLVARKRDGSLLGSYEDQVKPELEVIVRERVETLWAIGISGADLVIACVGAGLRAFTRYARVAYGNGEEVPAERFLAEVETAVLDAILAKLSKAVGANGGRYTLAGVDPATRFYTLWRFTYKSSELEAGEAIIFANGTHVELDGLTGLTSGSRPLTEKKKDKYRLLDFSDRGDDAKLGLPSEEGNPAPLIDSLHRLLWLIERHPSAIPDFLGKTRPNVEQLRLVAQALAGPALKGGELGEVASGTELAALTKLTANWRSLVEAEGPLFQNAR